MSLLDVALSCIRRGWYVFPCAPKDKNPLIPKADGGRGYKDATLDETQVREWWAMCPSANVGIATGKSGIIVLDVDEGLAEDAITEWCEDHGIPATLAVRTGSRPAYKVQFYFSNPDGVDVPSFNHWDDAVHAGDIRGTTWGHVMAVGSVHPSGAEYEILWDLPLAPVPGYARSLKAAPMKDKEGKPLPPRTLSDTGPIDEWRNDAMTRLLGQARNEGQNDDQIRETAYKINEERMQPPLDEDELDAIISHACDWPIGQKDPVAILPTKKEAAPEPPRDWREKYHTREEMINAPPVNWVIKDFLPEESICGLGAPAGQRKSLIALNVAHACLTEEPLFGKFPVIMKPERVLYLCPEMGIRSFTDRLRRIGLTDHIGETLFCMTMSSPELVELKELTEEEVRGSLVILDTAIRYLKGDENSSEAMKEFAKEIFRLSKAGALAVLVLHHSGKGAKSSDELTLENCMRGSGEIGAFLTTCWGTRINGDDAYKSPSYLQNVKQRDAIYEALEVSSDDLSCRLTYVERPEGAKAVLSVRKTGPKPKPDDPAAEAIVKATPWLSDRALVQVLKDNGFTRSRDWVKKRLLDIKNANGGLMPSKPPGHNPS